MVEGGYPVQLRFTPMTDDYASAIVAWHYDGIYSFYDLEQDREDLEEFLHPKNRGDKYFAVLDEEDELIGFFSFSKEDKAVVVGLGLRPNHTGRGLGLEFVQAGLEFARKRFAPSMLRLIVAMFNQRAIRVYEKAGFRHDKVFMHETNGGKYEYLQMMREA